MDRDFSTDAQQGRQIGQCTLIATMDLVSRHLANWAVANGLSGYQASLDSGFADVMANKLKMIGQKLR